MSNTRGAVECGGDSSGSLVAPGFRREAHAPEHEVSGCVLSSGVILIELLERDSRSAVNSPV